MNGKPCCYGQTDGVVQITLPDGAGSIEIDRDNTQSLLSIVLTAIRVEGDPDKINACRMMCRAMLGGS